MLEKAPKVKFDLHFRLPTSIETLTPLMRSEAGPAAAPAAPFCPFAGLLFAGNSIDRCYPDQLAPEWQAGSTLIYSWRPRKESESRLSFPLLPSPLLRIWLISAQIRSQIRKQDAGRSR